MRAGVLQYVKPITNVNHVDQAVLDDRIAPHDDFGLEVGVADIGVEKLRNRRRWTLT